MDEKKLKLAAKSILEKKKGIGFTGAGISTASGVPDFRSPTGIWAQYNPREYAYIDSFRKNPKKIWEFFFLREKEFNQAVPNPGHTALAELENLNYIDGIITQNIDRLHSRAGNKNVYELHGSVGELVCLECSRRYKREDSSVDWKESFPYCQCGEILKPSVVLFGEALPHDVFNMAIEIALKSKFMIVAGTSGIVYPAAQIPYMAKRNGSFIIEANMEATPLTSSITDVFLQGRVEEILPLIVENVKKMS